MSCGPEWITKSISPLTSAPAEAAPVMVCKSTVRPCFSKMPASWMTHKYVDVGEVPLMADFRLTTAGLPAADCPAAPLGAAGDVHATNSIARSDIRYVKRAGSNLVGNETTSACIL